MENRVNLPPRGDSEAEGHVGDDFFHFEWTGLFHLELLGSVHVEIGPFVPNFIPHFPGCEPRGYLFLHFLLGHLVDGLGSVLGSR